MTGASNHIVIIGGGVIGTASAYYLLKSGWKVTILERGQFGKTCSDGNCGLVCPSHVLPLATPGAIQSALKALFARNSPFKIKPRIDLSLWTWLLQFARRSNHQDMMASAVGIQALLNSSRLLYETLIREEAIECEWQTRGLLFVFQTLAAMEHYTHTDELLRDSFQMGAKRYDSKGLEELEPALKPGLAGAWHYEGDAHLRPDRLMISWRKYLESQGVTIRSNCEWLDFDAPKGIVRGINTNQGKLQADAFLVATGAVTPQFNQKLGCKIPIQPGKGYSITMPRPSICPAIPMIFEEHRVAVTPMNTGYRIGSMMEFAGYDSSINPKRLALLKSGAEHYLREPYAEPVMDEWYGWRPMTTDSKPILDRAPIYQNVWIAAGHNMLGLSMAPATGKLMSEIIGAKIPHLDPEPYSLARFYPKLKSKTSLEIPLPV